MAPKGTKKQTSAAQIGVRLDAETLARLDALRTRLAIPGVELGRADVARAAIIAGLDELEKRGRSRKP